MINIVKYSILENFRNKFYIACFGLIAFIAWFSHYSSQIAYNNENYTLTILSLGMYFTKLMTLIYIIFLPVLSLSREIESGTIYMILSKKVRRCEYIIGKFLSYLIVYFILVCLATAALWICGFLLVSPRPPVNFKICYFIFTQTLSGAMLLSIVFMLYAAIRVPVLTAVFSAAVYMLSLLLDTAKEVAGEAQNILVKYFYLFLYYIFPNFRLFDLEKNIIYNQPVDPKYFLVLLAYALGFTALMLFATSLFFNKKEL